MDGITLSPIETMGRPGHGAQMVGGPTGGGGVARSVASPFAASDVTPEVIRARFPATKFPERITLVNDNLLNTGAPNPLVQTWHAIEVDRPTILWPIDNLNAMGVSVNSDGTTPNNAYSGALTLYWPSKRPPPATGFPDAFVSDRHGICYLSGPGTWWLMHTNMQVSTSSRITYLIVDAADTGTVARLLQEPGCNNATIPSVTAGVYFLSVGVASATLVPNNRNRTALVIQNTGVLAGVPAARSIRLGFGTSANASGGVILGPGGSMTLTGEMLWRGRVFSILDAASTASGNVEAIGQEFQ